MSAQGNPRVRPLKDCGELLTGGTPSRAEPRFWGGTVPWISAKSLKAFDVIDSEERLTSAGAVVATRVPPGSVLFVVRGMSLANEFRVGVASQELTFNQDLRAIVPAQGIDGRYLGRFLQAESTRVLALVDEASHGTKRLTSGRFENIDVPVPSINQQRRIARILDRAEALRAKRRAAIAHLDKLTQAIFLEMFGDTATNRKNWSVIGLGELISVGPQNGLYKPASEYGSGTPILRIDGFYDGVVTRPNDLKRVRVSENEKSLYGLRAGEIVINRVNSREYLGKSALIPHFSETTVFESNMMRFDVDRTVVHPEYFIQLLQTRHVRAHILRSAKDAVNQSSINQQDVKSISVLVPPLSLQHVFTKRVAAVVRCHKAQRTSLAQFDSFFASLQHRAFRGKL